MRPGVDQVLALSILGWMVHTSDLVNNNLLWVEFRVPGVVTILM
jgi:hypothetical protein